MRPDESNSIADCDESGDASPAIGFDREHYRDLIEELGLPEDRADEFLQTLWDMMRRFVDDAWDSRPRDCEKA